MDHTTVLVNIYTRRDAIAVKRFYFFLYLQSATTFNSTREKMSLRSLGKDLDFMAHCLRGCHPLCTQVDRNSSWSHNTIQGDSYGSRIAGAQGTRRSGMDLLKTGERICQALNYDMDTNEKQSGEIVPAAAAERAW